MFTSVSFLWFTYNQSRPISFIFNQFGAHYKHLLSPFTYSLFFINCNFPSLSSFIYIFLFFLRLLFCLVLSSLIFIFSNYTFFSIFLFSFLLFLLFSVYSLSFFFLITSFFVFFTYFCFSSFFFPYFFLPFSSVFFFSSNLSLGLLATLSLIFLPIFVFFFVFFPL